MGTADRAQKILDAINDGIVTKRPEYRMATVLRCSKCLVRFGIADHRAALQLEGPCKCGGMVKVVGYWARLEPRGKAVSNG